jgi:tyrosyl-tRNA synthetase
VRAGDSVAAVTSVDEQMQVLTAGTVQCITPDELSDRLDRGRPLRVKLGLDPSRPDIHIGHAVVLRKLRQFQEFGHTAVLIVGDFTAQVGDPSARSATRPALSKAEADANAATYFEQAQHILLPDRLEIRHNSEWLGEMGIDDVLRLAARSTVARMLERDDFAKRYTAGNPISVMELLYPLLQGWDSVMVRADVELGGTDQLFNLLAARGLQEKEGQEAQVVMTMPLLEGLDGTQKMSKSLGNYIGVTEPPDEQFGKLMSIPDEALERYFELTTGWHPDRVEQVVAELGGATGADRNRLKRLLARTVVDLYHGEAAGEAAETAFDRVFRAGEAPEDMPERVVAAVLFADGPVRLARVLAEAGLVASNREGARKINEGAVRRNGEKIEHPELEVAAADVDGAEFQVGKRKWARVRVR